jgi:transposase
MSKIESSAQFKHYQPQQILLLPPSLDELIDDHHLVRVINQVVNSMDISSLINQYKGGGTTAFHPRMLLKILLYAYSVKIYTGRKIAKALRQDIHFMWLSGMSRPDFRTINNFRGSRAKEVIEKLFEQVLLFLIAQKHVKLENYFCDGSTFAADANKHKMVWKKNAERFKEGAEEKCRELFKQIDALNAAEDKQYAGADLEERGLESKEITTASIREQVEKLDAVIASADTGKKMIRKAGSLKKKLEEKQDKIADYEKQIGTAAGRSGYNKTDKEASGMRMKNKELLPAYNVLAGCEDQFIVSVSIHQNPNDGSCFKEHFEKLNSQGHDLPKAIIADSIFGTEQNYELLEKAETVTNYLKFPSFHAEKKQSYKKNRFLKDNFKYDAESDTYACPNEKQLILQKTYQQTHKKTGYQSTIKEYQCQDCNGCPFYQQCCKSTTGENRLIKVNENLDAYKQQARENLNSEKGVPLRKKRSIEIESCFGDIKHNMGFKRFHLRGLKKVETEMCLVAIAHNLRKLQIKGMKKAA